MPLQERLVNGRNADVWFDYGACLLRLGKIGRAEECLRECLGAAPGHLDALLALTALSLHNGLTTDPLLLETAFATTHELRQLQPGSALASALQVRGSAVRRFSPDAFHRTALHDTWL